MEDHSQECTPTRATPPKGNCAIHQTTLPGFSDSRHRTFLVAPGGEIGVHDVPVISTASHEASRPRSRQGEHADIVKLRQKTCRVAESAEFLKSQVTVGCPGLSGLRAARIPTVTRCHVLTEAHGRVVTEQELWPHPRAPGSAGDGLRRSWTSGSPVPPNCITASASQTVVDDE